GVKDHHRSVHWQHGLLLDNGLHGRALLTMEGNHITVTVRAAYPHNLLARLTEDIRAYVEDFWQGLEVRVMVPCAERCPDDRPGQGVFDTEALINVKAGRGTEISCSSCFKGHDIDSLMLDVVTRPLNTQERLVEAVAAVMSEQFTPMLQLAYATHDELTKQSQHIRELADVIDLRYRELMNALDDPARDGPRLITVQREPGTVLEPGWTHVRIRITLWCEHSRRPLHLLDNDPTVGVYVITVPKDWLIKAAPLLTAISRVLRSVLPLTGLLDVALPDSAKTWTAISDQLGDAEKTIEGLATATKPDASTEDATVVVSRHGTGHELDEASIRRLHQIVKEQDPGFGGLQRVNDRGRYRWIHPQYLTSYQQGG
ncbi:hypothetical protein, partial [Allorhizocola rhizosphaerae]|uniref:hypothetical protein n=1 Tax=Allorhizocola rhizosphaerae TaxID=1872709 RepID=UPI001B8B126B